MIVYLLTNTTMTKTTLELTPETHENFLKLKVAIEDMAGESVTDDQVVDFMIRSMLNAVELPEEEGEGCGCCGHDHHHHGHHEHHHHEHHHCDCEDESNEDQCECGNQCECGDQCECDEENHCGCKSQ